MVKLGSVIVGSIVLAILGAGAYYSYQFMGEMGAIAFAVFIAVSVGSAVLTRKAFGGNQGGGGGSAGKRRVRKSKGER